MPEPPAACPEASGAEAAAGAAGHPEGAGTLDAETARRWLRVATADLRAGRAELDRLNVYPVPDRDTGTNLHLTLTCACEAADEVAGTGVTVGDLLRAAARGALRGARGNSGVILSQLLHGWADALAGVRAATAGHVADALGRADEQAWVAVESPTEGTILSVSRAAAQAASGAGPHADLCSVVSAAAAAARTALDRTTGQLDVLARAGVVDAGAAGLVLVLDALAAVVTGRAQPAPGPRRTTPLTGTAAAHDTGEEAQGRFEVMYLLDAPDEEVPALRARLAALGRSVSVVGGEEQWNVHVHTDEPDAAVEAGASVGRPHAVTTQRIERDDVAADDAPATDAGPAADHSPAAESAHEPVGMVAWVSGPGTAQAFEAAGAVTVTTPPDRLLATQDVLAAVLSTGSRSVVVLPNDPDVMAPACGAAAAAAGELRVLVVPTRAEVQGLAAVAVHDPASGLEDDVAAMSAAAGHTRYGSVTPGTTVTAVDSAASTAPGGGSHGDVLGLVDGEVVAVGPGVQAVALEVLDRLMREGADLVTLVRGAGTSPEVAEAVASAVRVRRPDAEVVVLDGGQPGMALLVGVE